VAAYGTPECLDGFGAPVTGRKNKLYYPADYLQGRLQFTVIDPPGHGVVDPMSSGLKWFEYEPEETYTGVDSFTFKFEDTLGNESPVYTYRLRVRRAGERAGLLIKVVVDDKTYSETKNAIDRYVEQLGAEGYSAETVMWNGTSARELWEYLREEYADPGKPLVGVVLMGSVPTPEHGDHDYWDLATFGLEKSLTFHIWVSRYYPPSERYGTKSELLKRALEANFNYRTGRSRLPQTAAMINAYKKYAELETYGQVWDAEPARSDRTVKDCMTSGAGFCHRSDHDSPVSLDWLYGNSNQLRFAFMSGCKAGRPGEAVSNFQYTRGGGNIVSMGSKFDTYFWFRLGQALEHTQGVELLEAGEPLGMVMLERGADVIDYGAYVYGDLSTGVLMDEHNLPPYVAELSVSEPNPVCGEVITFTATGGDSDGSSDNSPYTDYELRSEWWFEGVQGHTREFDHANSIAESDWSESMTYAYTRPHIYTARVELTDEWLARGWKEVTVKVRPDSHRPLRVNCGAGDVLATRCALGDIEIGDGTVWLYDQSFTRGTWGHSGDNGGKPSDGGKSVNDNVSGADNAVIYQYWRNVRKQDEDQEWRFPFENGGYTVRLHFADMMSSGAGQRLVDARLEGEQILDGFDVYAHSGSHTVVVKSFPVQLSDGEITLVFRKNESSREDAFINGIEIIPDNMTASKDFWEPVTAMSRMSLINGMIRFAPQGRGELEILRPDGRLVLDRSFSPGTENNVSLRELVGGYYFIRMRDGRNMRTYGYVSHGGGR